MTKKNKLLLIDGSSIAFRAFYAIPGSLDRFMNKNGLHTNALFSFHRMLDNEMKKEQPTHVLVAFDAGKTTFRNAFYDAYKDGRQKTPGEFKEQMPYLRDLLEGFGIPHYELDNYEADDIIGTLATVVDPNEFDVVVVSGDRDLTQLAKENVRVDITIKGVSEIEENTPAYLMEKYGIEPHQIIDMKGLAGDSSDNIPGVTNIGEKTALKLLHEFGSVEGVYENIDGMKPSKRKENLINDKEQALLSKKLATIEVDAPLEIKVDELLYTGKDVGKLIEFYKEMDFKSFLKDLDTTEYDEENKIEKAEIIFEFVTELKADMFGPIGGLYVEMLTDNYHTAEIVGLSWSNGEKIYVAEPDVALASPIFQEWAKDPANKKQVFDAKRTVVALQRYDTTLEGVDFDVLLASYILNTNDNSKDLAEVAMEHDYYEVAADESIYGKGAKLAIPEDASVLNEHLARKIKAIEVLSIKLKQELIDSEQTALFYEMELPLSMVLAEMEMTGIKVNANRLLEMKAEFAIRLTDIENRIYEEAGETFNINSPKQLGVILFEKMQLPVIKKTKTGYSTAVDVLEQLRPQAPIVDDILHYRQIAKIQSTYVEGLLKVINGNTGKVHTRYVQTLTQTGRLSSVDPNLQNIPIRLEEGRKIRQAFVPSHEGWKIFASDYSQIELRVLADISNDQHLKEAFLEGQDIHSSTAMRVFGIEKAEDVTGNMRRQAKAVNFGIVYGISDYGLSQNLGITRKEAQTFIDTYFEKYPGVKQYMSDIVREAKDKGYVETLFHRRRFLKDINSRNFNLRSFAERTAMNTPIQGSAADIIKVAMIQMDRRLKAENLKTKMLLQVHDELIFEAPEEEIAILEKLVPEVMESAVKLNVPLKVDSSYGDSWYDAK
ncbi:MAG: DNA polymerase I [Carnobacterium sp.]|uniref:DNA polymerase I n=1 Tax=Carnobacterium maltaromaticum TaxID=2751 RepID=A0AAW9K2K1_CARML|nr:MULTISPECIES: DNA polymerase I [Carnobacterium]KRN84332.1 DNA polymerase I [Carnobacterium maltaromaticum]MBQ6486022.1 DNA polymerase I [Carnobacterium sp.]MDT1946115.1 DNA polymerase I [Carnobacterium maltaromaticum]MDT2000619.1 DNA polymerase I [Carnobacterium maltaromaticum]MDZ5760080.1 DNA polymerase I [Carnobacterium maltaromaticum]